MTALLFALWAGDAAAARLWLTVSPSPATVGESADAIAYTSTTGRGYIRTYAEPGGTSCAATAAQQDAGGATLLGSMYVSRGEHVSGRFTPSSAGEILVCAYLSSDSAGSTPTATAVATLRVLGAAAAPTLAGATSQKLTRAGITVRATFPRGCSYTAGGTATVGERTYSFKKQGRGATFARAGTVTIRLAPTDYTPLRAAIDAGRAVGVNVTVTAKYPSGTYSSSRAITLK